MLIYWGEIFCTFRLLKKQITIPLDKSTIEHFKELALETGFSCQALINLYLKDCAENHKKLRVKGIEPSYWSKACIPFLPGEISYAGADPGNVDRCAEGPTWDTR